MSLDSICDYIESRIDAIDAAVKRGEWSDSMHEELRGLASLLRQMFESMIV